MSGGYYSREEIRAIVDKIRSTNPRGGNGHAFFVDGIAGSDSYPGDSPGRPFQKIATALGNCTNNRDDYIIALDCWQQDAFPIDVNKHRVHIIGLDSGNGKYPRMAPPGDTAIFLLGTGEYVEVAGFSLGGGATHGCIEWKDNINTGRSKLHDLWLGWTDGAQDGIRVPVNADAPEIEIARCWFGSSLTRDGVRLIGNATRSVIRDNLFRLVGGVGINALKNGSDLGAILRNRFKCADAATGEAITLALGAGNAIIDGNRAGQGAAAMGNRPYRDLSTGVLGTCLNAWLNNYDGIVAVYPVVV